MQIKTRPLSVMEHTVALRVLSAELLVLLVNIRVRHSRDVVADDARQGLCLGFLLIALRQLLRVLDPKVKKVGNDALCIVFFRIEGWTEVKILVEEVFSFATFGFGLGT